GCRITAAATTGPASGPRPASSTPATRVRSWHCRAVPSERGMPAARAAHAPGARENRLRRPRGAATAQRAMHRGEFFQQLTHVPGILEFLQQRLAERRAAHLLLKELR